MAKVMKPKVTQVSTFSERLPSQPEGIAMAMFDSGPICAMVTLPAGSLRMVSIMKSTAC